MKKDQSTPWIWTPKVLWEVSTISWWSTNLTKEISKLFKNKEKIEFSEKDLLSKIQHDLDNKLRDFVTKNDSLLNERNQRWSYNNKWIYIVINLFYWNYRMDIWEIDVLGDRHKGIDKARNEFTSDHTKKTDEIKSKTSYADITSLIKIYERFLKNWGYEFYLGELKKGLAIEGKTFEI